MSSGGPPYLLPMEQNRSRDPRISQRNQPRVPFTPKELGLTSGNNDPQPNYMLPEDNGFTLPRRTMDHPGYLDMDNHNSMYAQGPQYMMAAYDSANYRFPPFRTAHGGFNFQQQYAEEASLADQIDPNYGIHLMEDSHLIRDPPSSSNFQQLLYGEDGEQFYGDNEASAQPQDDNVPLPPSSLPAERPRVIKKRGSSRGDTLNDSPPPRTGLRPSRYSGNPLSPPGVSKTPPVVPDHTVSNAALRKRGLKRKNGEPLSLRSVGANDPENTSIVDMYDHDDLSWKEIADRLNDIRVMKGLKPSHTANSVHNRYNRNAPLIFRGRDQEWIPVSKRKDFVHGKGKVRKEDRPYFEWNAETEDKLVQIVKEVDSWKWGQVADIFNHEHDTDMTEDAVAMKYTLI